MNFNDQHEFIKILQEYNELKIINDELDIYLEIPQLAYIEVKKPDSKALLFTNPIDKKSGKKFDIPVLMNIFGSFSRLNLIVQKDHQKISADIANLLKLSPPKGLKNTIQKLKEIFYLRHTMPKKIKNAPCQAVQKIAKNGDEINLYDLPILTTWELDAAPFITMGQVYTQSLDGAKKNLGMYRLQLFDKNHLGLHWQIHKDSNHFFHEYKKAGKKMPVSIALGGDPLYIWCGQAPLPMGVFELMLYGFIRGKRAQIVQCLTNPLCVPAHADIVIEGWVDCENLRLEGPFGDHTGFYTPIEPYPVLEVSAITHKIKPIYPATIVGKPPLEDKYFGYLTERIFLPLLQTTTHGLIDYAMPENGVFHNLILAKFAPQYPGHSMQLAHAFWGVGQMSFVKHAIFVPHSAPELRDFENLARFILDRFSPQSLIITQGVCDALDHSSPEFGIGGKLGVLIDSEISQSKGACVLSNSQMLEKLQNLSACVKGVYQFCTDSKNPICAIGVQKEQSLKAHFQNLDSEICAENLSQNLKIAVLVDYSINDLENAYMLVWRVTNNIDAKRDIWVQNDIVFVDATQKGAVDGHFREWPKSTDCNSQVIENLQAKGLLDGVDSEFLQKFGILE